jgi:hypothetical protein
MNTDFNIYPINDNNFDNNIDDNDKTLTKSIDNILKVITTVISENNALKHDKYFSLLRSAHKCSFITNINLIKSSAKDLLSLNEMGIEDSKYGGKATKRTLYEMYENNDSINADIIKKQMIERDNDENHNTDEKNEIVENYLEEHDDYISEDTIKNELINSFYYIINSIKFTREFIKINGHLYIDPDIINLYEINDEINDKNINLLFDDLNNLDEIHMIKLLLIKHLPPDLQR